MFNPLDTIPTTHFCVENTVLAFMICLRKPSRVSFAKKYLRAVLNATTTTIYQYKANETHHPVKIISRLFSLIIRHNESASQKPKTTDISLSEFIGYGIRPQNQNYCIISIINHKALIFKSVRGFCDIPTGCFTIFLSILMIKNLPIRFTTKAIAGDQF